MSILKVANIHFDVNGTTLIRANGANTLTINTSGSENVRVDAAGNVLVGRTDSIVGNNVKLDVNGAANTSDILVNGVSVSPFGRQTIWIPARAFYTTALPASSGTFNLGVDTEFTYNTYDFDASSFEAVATVIQMPKSWNESNLIFQALWSHGATTTNFGVVWQFAAHGFQDGSSLASTLTNSVQVSDTGGTTNAIYITPESSSFLPGGTVVSEGYLYIRVARMPSDAADTLAVDARLHGVKIHYTIDAARDN